MFCNICYKTDKLQRCARCKKVYYCCREHQTKDWRDHKKVCRTDKDPIHTAVEGKMTEVLRFDQRSFACTTFGIPAADDELGKFVIDQLQSEGYCVLDDYLPLTSCTQMLDEIRQLDKTGRMTPGKLAGGKTSGVQNEMVINSSIRSDKIVWIEGNEDCCPAISNYINNHLDSLVQNINEHMRSSCFLQGRTKAMAACYPGGGAGYKRHVDNPTQDGRRLTCIMYLNPDWDAQNDGGVLRIFETKNKERYVDVIPAMNRLLVFWSNKSPHEVQPAFKTRYALTVWYFDETERQIAKAQQTNKETEEVRSKIAEVEVKTKEMQKEIVQQKLENESKKAVGALSTEEIQAIAALIGDRPDARSMLEDMGISSVIIEQLLRQLQEFKK